MEKEEKRKEEKLPLDWKDYVAMVIALFSFMLSPYFCEGLSYQASAWIMIAATYMLDIIAWLLIPRFFNRLLIAERYRF